MYVWALHPRRIYSFIPTLLLLLTLLTEIEAGTFEKLCASPGFFGKGVLEVNSEPALMNKGGTILLQDNTRSHTA
ncbi:hypothetical protein RB195_008663 [Necator americanus]|uniref:Uncharacterized protein n=1 Tax=Necator americanus TaxID=51031 RepID=A0ABR1CPS0_NECAM